jgi:hypothetical protein
MLISSLLMHNLNCHDFHIGKIILIMLLGHEMRSQFNPSLLLTVVFSSISTLKLLNSVLKKGFYARLNTW